jgi:hypothetical protein
MEADCSEWLGCRQADDIVTFSAKLGKCVPRRDRYSEHEARYLVLARTLQRRLHRAAGGDAIIDDDDSPAVHRNRRPTADIGLAPTFYLKQLACEFSPDIVFPRRELANGLGVENKLWLRTVHDGADAELLMARRTDLPNEEQIQLSVKRQGDFEGDGHPAPRQGKHQRIAVAERAERSGELPTGIPAIMEERVREHNHAFKK